jgi:hypothetical protein
VLDVGYAEAGPRAGLPVILLHGWPYDIHSYVDVAPRLAAWALRRQATHTVTSLPTGIPSVCALRSSASSSRRLPPSSTASAAAVAG